MVRNFGLILESIYEQDPRYKEDAYVFVMEALTYTQKKYKCDKHVSGQDMLEGIKELLLNKFGPLAITVLEYWGIKTTEDFGNIVFNLVEKNVLSKTEDDNIETFRNGYDFHEVFRKGYRKKLAKKISRMRSI